MDPTQLCDIGIKGLATMGANLARNAASAAHTRIQQTPGL